MAKRKTKKQNPLVGLIVFVIALAVVLFGRLNGDFEFTTSDDVNASVSNDTVVVHIINVGQGSSALVQCGETGMLIDAGERDYGSVVVKYLKDAGIKKLEYVVASHPHSDHIGGLTDVLDAFSVKNIIMPELSEINMPTTRTYEKLLMKIADKNINAIAAEYGSQYKLGGATLQVFGPVKQDKDLNDMSVICKVTAVKTAFLFPGDAEKAEMSSVMPYSPNLKCDVMAMAHHGSNTSIEKSFLKKANPSVAVISCGQDNSYGHPHKEAVKYLKDNSIEYYRTDKHGNIIFTCNKNGYTTDSRF